MKDDKYVVLLIDDDDDFLEALNVLVQSWGYKTVTAGSAEEGLKKHKASPADLIIVDLMMEEVDAGAQFVKELKLMGSATPVFLLSGAGDSMSTGVDYTKLGFSGVFQKPIDAGRLLNVLKAKLK